MSCITITRKDRRVFASKVHLVGFAARYSAIAAGAIQDKTTVPSRRRWRQGAREPLLKSDGSRCGPSGCGGAGRLLRRRSSAMSRIACVAPARIRLGGVRNAPHRTCAEVP